MSKFLTSLSADPVGAAFGGQCLLVLIAKSAHNPGLGPDGLIAADLTYGDYSAERIKKLRWLFQVDSIETRAAASFFFNLRFMASALFATGDLGVNIRRMIDHFQENTGTNYSSDELNTAVKAHERYLAFRQELDDQLRAALINNKGDIGKLIVNKDVSIKTHLMFNTTLDKVTGLTIAINDVWAWRAEIVEYQITGKNYAGKYRVTMYDHFGLDEPDVDASKFYGNLAGFRSWFILQHYTRFAYQPFITVIALDESFSGVLD